ncbi:MAG: lipoyl(octanoyl) transferase LipB [Candidatus Dasytiphilus stammeri]
MSKSYKTFVIRQLGLQSWLPVYLAMHKFTKKRNSRTLDELWLLEHYPVFTQGNTGKSEHILMSSDDIPVLQSDRGGQVTYHGPGQLIMYIMIDLKRRKISIRQLITFMEQSVINTLNYFNLKANVRTNAPGVYICNRKICSLGLRIHHGCSLHGLALNIAMDLSPFQRINPCGFSDLEMTQLSEFYPYITLLEVQQLLLYKFISQFQEIY